MKLHPMLQWRSPEYVRRHAQIASAQSVTDINAVDISSLEGEERAAIIETKIVAIELTEELIANTFARGVNLP